MNLIRQLTLTTAFVVVITVNLFSVNSANAENPNFSTETGTLSIPVLNVDGTHQFNNVEIGFDFATQLFELKNLEPVDIAFNPINELEENNSLADAQPLSALGANSPVNAEINPTGDRDWYSFEVVAEQTYVVELFDVANNLALASDYDCNNSKNSGLWFAIYDTSTNEVARQCKLFGSGNVYTVLGFKAGVSGTFYLEIAPYAKTVLGSYKFRVLPKHDEPNASWDSATFEPNNWWENAYRIVPGWDNAITGTIEPRNSAYSTNNADHDWYQFDSVAGRTYIIELFDVISNLALVSDYDCGESRYGGLWLSVYDPSINQVLHQCQPYGAGNVHTIAQFTAGVDGPSYIRVAPHANSVSGTYKLRVLPKHDEPGASWDPVTFEPNNRIANAYPIIVGRENALTSTIEPHEDIYSTNQADIDLYRFKTVAGITYVVELFDVNSNLQLASGTNCSSSRYSGLWLLVWDQTGHEVVRQCKPEGINTVHTSVNFMASVNGIYYISVIPHESSVSGDYSIRVLSQ